MFPFLNRANFLILKSCFPLKRKYSTNCSNRAHILWARTEIHIHHHHHHKKSFFYQLNSLRSICLVCYFTTVLRHIFANLIEKVNRFDNQTEITKAKLASIGINKLRLGCSGVLRVAFGTLRMAGHNRCLVQFD